MAFQSGFAAVLWLIFASLLPSCFLVVPPSATLHCLHLFPSDLSALPSLQFIPWLWLVALTEPDCSLFPELIGVTLAWQETQRHYGDTSSITGQRINTLSVIFNSHSRQTNGSDEGYLLKGTLSASPGGTHWPVLKRFPGKQRISI